MPPHGLNEGMRIQENGDIMNHGGQINRPLKLATKPFLLQDLEAAMLLSASIQQTPLITNNVEPLPITQQHRFEPAHDLVIQNSPSMPLYRRQPAQNPETTMNPVNRNLPEEINVEQFLNNFNMIHLNSKAWELDKVQSELKVINRDMYINNMQEMDYNVNKNQPIQVTGNDKINGNQMPGFANFSRAMFQPPPRHLAPAPVTESPYINDFHLNGREQDIDESATTRHSNIETTYASVLRAQPTKNQRPEEEKIGDPFGILKDLANSSSSRRNNGLYQYFS